eukprot:gnl/MRDRNA2_/MRDRNA2_87982_c0_seq1.p1 gnl/MRDRNA2_/MRDRNA2_87982_c0~~gnl/MRDRNA2_/MRDRNA2_87982_c0_seq1.p1  ORF type:complete len:361 (+),score=47.36 gnl/MRDRNA2_/MRDRNA2_87982_c0_seq1:79-1161(+)
MVSGPLCRPNAPAVRFESNFVFEKNILSCAGKSSLPLLLNSFRKPSLEEKHLLWASFSCRKNGEESPLESSQDDDGSGSPSALDLECTDRSIKSRRAEQELEIETDSSPFKSVQAGSRKCTERDGGFQFPTPPSGPRGKALSPKDLHEIRKTSTKDGEERKSPVTSPVSRPPTPPTMPRTSQAPQYRRRLATTSETDGITSSNELSSKPEGQIGADFILGDFRQCPGTYFEKLHAKFHAKPRCEASCHSASTVPKKKVLALTAKQLGRGQDDSPSNELSESWKRFEWRKQMRKERSRSKNRLRQLNPEVVSLSFKALRLYGQITPQLAQPPQAFSYRSPSGSGESMFMTQVENTAYRKWI